MTDQTSQPAPHVPTLMTVHAHPDDEVIGTGGTMARAVGEGRRVIGNIERVSNLFLTKTVYSVLLALLVGLAGLSSKWFGTAPLLYPFQPIHVTIAAWFTIGIPAFILSLAPNHERARTGFVRRVMTNALPAGIVVGATVGIDPWNGGMTEAAAVEPAADRRRIRSAERSYIR